MTPARTTSYPSLFSLAAALTLPMIAPCAMADFIGDSKARIDMRNQYINRDFRQDNAPQSKAEEWAQGFTARIESGFTDGTFGFGLDALGSWGSSSTPARTAVVPACCRSARRAMSPTTITANWA